MSGSTTGCRGSRVVVGAVSTPPGVVRPSRRRKAPSGGTGGGTVDSSGSGLARVATPRAPGSRSAAAAAVVVGASGGCSGVRLGCRSS